MTPETEKRLKAAAREMYEALRTLDEYYANEFLIYEKVGERDVLQSRLWEMSRAALEAADGLRWEARHCLRPSHVARISDEVRALLANIEEKPR